MTSMLLTDRQVLPAVDSTMGATEAMTTRCRSRVGGNDDIKFSGVTIGDDAMRLGFLPAVARRDVLLLCVCGRGILDHSADELTVGLDPVGYHLPLLAVPLLELHRAAALVIHARDL